MDKKDEKRGKMNATKKQNEIRVSVKLFLLFILSVTIGLVAYESMSKKNRLDGEVQAVGVVISDDGAASKGLEPPVSGVVLSVYTNVGGIVRHVGMKTSAPIVVPENPHFGK